MTSPWSAGASPARAPENVCSRTGTLENFLYKSFTLWYQFTPGVFYVFAYSSSCTWTCMKGCSRVCSTYWCPAHGRCGRALSCVKDLTIWPLGLEMCAYTACVLRVWMWVWIKMCSIKKVWRRCTGPWNCHGR